MLVTCSMRVIDNPRAPLPPIPSSRHDDTRSLGDPRWCAPTCPSTARHPDAPDAARTSTRDSALEFAVPQ